MIHFAQIIQGFLYTLQTVVVHWVCCWWVPFSQVLGSPVTWGLSVQLYSAVLMYRTLYNRRCTSPWTWICACKYWRSAWKNWWKRRPCFHTPMVYCIHLCLVMRSRYIIVHYFLWYFDQFSFKWIHCCLDLFFKCLLLLVFVGKLDYFRLSNLVQIEWVHSSIFFALIYPWWGTVLYV